MARNEGEGTANQEQENEVISETWVGAVGWTADGDIQKVLSSASTLFYLSLLITIRNTQTYKIINVFVISSKCSTFFLIV